METPDAGGLLSSAFDRMLGAAFLAAWPPGRLLMLLIIQCSVSRAAAGCENFMCCDRDAVTER